MTPRERDSRLADNTCPVCSFKLTAATYLPDESIKPQPGDYSCCIECAAFLVFDDDMRMEHFPDEKMMEMEDEHRHELIDMRRAIMKVKEKGEE